MQRIHRGAIRIAKRFHVALCAFRRIDTLFTQGPLHRALVCKFDVVRRGFRNNINDIGDRLRWPAIDQLTGTPMDVSHRRPFGRAVEIGDKFAYAIRAVDAPRLQCLIQCLPISRLSICGQIGYRGIADITRIERAILRRAGARRVRIATRRIAVASPEHLWAFVKRADCIANIVDVTLTNLSRQVGERHAYIHHIFCIKHDQDKPCVKITLVIVVELSGFDQFLCFDELLLQRLRNAIKVTAHFNDLAPGLHRVGGRQKHAACTAADFVEHCIRSTGAIGKRALLALHALEHRERAFAVDLLHVRTRAVLDLLHQRVERTLLPKESRVVAVLDPFEIFHEIRAGHLIGTV